MFENYITELDYLTLELIKSSTAKKIIQNEIKKTLIIEHYLKEFNLDNEFFNKEKYFEDYCKKININNEKDLEIFLKQKGLEINEYKESVFWEAQLNALKNSLIPKDVIKEIFLKEKSKFDNVIFAKIECTNETLLWELFYRAKDDKQDFSDLAIKYSSDKSNNIVGPVSFSLINHELKEKILNAKEGDLLPPFTLDGKKYLLIKILKINNSTLDNNIYEKIKNELFENWISRQLALSKIAFPLEPKVHENLLN